MAYICCENLQLGYDGNVIVKDLDFQINAGNYLCIIGENGAGKSTLVKTLLQLQKPLSGSLTIGDGLMPYEIGYLPQQTVVQRDFPATVWEIVLSGCLSKCGSFPFYKKEQKALVQEKMEEMGIWELRKKSYRTLSGGQQQRVLLARALCATSKLLLLDEPVNGLDPKVTADFYQMIYQLNQKGITIIMVSHDLHVLQYATHVLHVDSSESFFGTKEQYLESEKSIGFQMIRGVRC